MKNFDFKMKERFHRREQDEDRRTNKMMRELEKEKAKAYANSDADSDEPITEKQNFEEQLKRFNIRWC